MTRYSVWFYLSVAHLGDGSPHVLRVPGDHTVFFYSAPQSLTHLTTIPESSPTRLPVVLLYYRFLLSPTTPPTGNKLVIKKCTLGLCKKEKKKVKEPRNKSPHKPWSSVPQYILAEDRRMKTYTTIRETKHKCWQYPVISCPWAESVSGGGDV